MFTSLFLLAAICFVIYAIYKYGSTTPADEPMWKRVWLAIVAAGAALAAAIAALFHGAP